MLRKKTFLGLIALGMASPLLAETPDLVVVNNTNHHATAIINNGACSDKLPNGLGIIAPHSVNVIPGEVVRKVCIFHRSNCTAEVHMSDNCSLPSVGTITLDLTTGISTVRADDTTQGYRLHAEGFTTTIEGGSKLKNWLQRLFS